MKPESQLLMWDLPASTAVAIDLVRIEILALQAEILALRHELNVPQRAIRTDISSCDYL
jgi:hypothetical protein